MCANGHDRAIFWTTTKGGRKYCRKCAAEASARTRAKNPRPSKRAPKVQLSDAAIDAIVKIANFKTTSAAVAEELNLFVASLRPAELN